MTSASNDPSPPVFLFNEGSLPADIPGTWEDQSVNILRIKGEDAQAASLVISRETLPVGVSVSEYIEVELKRLQENLQDFELKARLPVDWPDRKGEAILSRWTSKDGGMDQITTCRVVEGRRILIFTGTHATPMPSGTYRTIMDVIAGFVPRAPGALS